MTSDDIVNEQLLWHRKAMQGCVFAAILANSNHSLKAGFKRECILNQLGTILISEVISVVASAIKEQETNLLSIIIPDINSKEKLLSFIDLLRETDWIIDDSDVYEGFQLIKIRVPLNEHDENDKMIYAWVLFFAPLPFFPDTRQSPFFEMALSVKSRYFLKDKYGRHTLTQQNAGGIDRRGQSHDAHLADVYIQNITDNLERDGRKWDESSKRKREVLTKQESIPFDDNRAKAKITCSYPLDV